MTRVTNWWSGDYDQNRAINDLDEELAAERAARRQQTRRLHETRQHLDKGLKQVDTKLAGVSERIETVLNWTELRFQLLEFDEYQARKEIRKTFRALAEDRPALPPVFADVPGYWLPPAAAAVLPLVLRDRGASSTGAAPSLPFADLKSGFATASERDAVRAELFNLAVGRSFDQPALIDAAVLRLLGEPADLGLAEPGQVAAGWRTLWKQAVLGDFGPAAADQLRDAVRARFDSAANDPETLDEDELEAWDRAIATFGSEDGDPLPRAEAYEALAAHLAFEPGPAADPSDGLADNAAVDLAGGGTGGTTGVLLDLPAEHTAPGAAVLDISTSDSSTSVAASSGGTVLSGTALSGTASSSTVSSGTPSSSAAPNPAERPRDDRAWHRYLQELIEEPSPAELPLVRDMEALELADADDGESRTRPSWTRPVGTVAELLRRDLFDPEGPVPLRRLALELAGPLLRSRLAAPEPPAAPAVVTVKRRSLAVAVTAEGHDEQQAAAVEARIAGPAETAPSKLLPGSITVSLLLLALIMVFAGQWVAAVFFAGVALIPVWWFRGRVADHVKDRQRREDQRADLHAALLRARDEAAARDERNAERRAADAKARTRLLDALGGA